MGLFSEDPRDQIIQDLRDENAKLRMQILSLVDQRAAAMTMAYERQKAKERSDANAMPTLPPMLNLMDKPGPAAFESDAAMEDAFRGKQ